MAIELPNSEQFIDALCDELSSVEAVRQRAERALLFWFSNPLEASSVVVSHLTDVIFGPSLTTHNGTDPNAVRHLAGALLRHRVKQLLPHCRPEVVQKLKTLVLRHMEAGDPMQQSLCALLIAEIFLVPGCYSFDEFLGTLTMAFGTSTGHNWEFKSICLRTVAVFLENNPGILAVNGAELDVQTAERFSKVQGAVIAGLKHDSVCVRKESCYVLRVLLPYMWGTFANEELLQLIIKPFISCLVSPHQRRKRGASPFRCQEIRYCATFNLKKHALQLKRHAMETLVAIADLYGQFLEPYMDALAAFTLTVLDEGTTPTLHNAFGGNGSSNTFDPYPGADVCTISDSNSEDSQDSLARADKAVLQEEEMLVAQAINFWSTLMEVEWGVRQQLAKRRESTTSGSLPAVQDEPLASSLAQGKALYEEIMATPTPRTASLKFLSRYIYGLCPFLCRVVARRPADGSTVDVKANTFHIAAGHCLRLCALVIGLDVVPFVVQFFNQYTAQPHWVWREAGLYILCSVLESLTSVTRDAPALPMMTKPDVSQVLPLQQWVPLIVDMLSKDESEEVRRTASLVLLRLAKFVPQVLRFHVGLVMPVVFVSLERDRKDVEVIENVCWTLIHLIKSMGQGMTLDPYFSSLLQKIMATATSPLVDVTIVGVAYEVLSWLFRYFPALSRPNYGKILRWLMDELRLKSNARLRAVIAGTIAELVEALSYEQLSPFADELLRMMFNLLNQPTAVDNKTDNLILTVGHVASIIEADFRPCLPHFIRVLLDLLRDRSDVHLTRVALSVLVHIAHAVGGCLGPYVKDIGEVLLDTTDPAQYIEQQMCGDELSSRREVLLDALLCYAELNVAMGEDICTLLPSMMSRLTELFDLPALDEEFLVNVRKHVLNTFSMIIVGVGARPLQPYARQFYHHLCTIVLCPPLDGASASTDLRPISSIPLPLLQSVVALLGGLVVVLKHGFMPMIRFFLPILVQSLDHEDSVVQENAIYVLTEVMEVGDDPVLSLMLNYCADGLKECLASPVRNVSDKAANCVAQFMVALEDNLPQSATDLFSAWLKAIPIKSEDEEDNVLLCSTLARAVRVFQPSASTASHVLGKIPQFLELIRSGAMAQDSRSVQLLEQTCLSILSDITIMLGPEVVERLRASLPVEDQAILRSIWTMPYNAGDSVTR